MTKITFLGAGSVVFTKNLLGDILSFPELRDSVISLHDIDAARLETAERMARWTAKALGAAPAIEAHLDRRQALDGAGYVINMIQVGGHPATLVDFDIPRKYGLKQTIADSHGVGGLFRALRTIPVMRDIARDMEAVCPGAIMLNYTNPMSMLCWAWFASTRLPIVGLCHSVQGTTQQISAYAGVPYDEVTYLGAGINHVAWILRFEHNGQDAYPLLRRALEEGRIPRDDLVRAELFRRLGYYVTESSEHNAEYNAHFIPHAGQIEKFNIPIDEYLRRSAENLKEFEATRAKLQRGESFKIERSAEYASLIIHSMETHQPRVIYGNVRNDQLIDNLPAGCCVEVPCLVDRNGIQPTHVGPLPPQLAAMDRLHVAVQELTVRAALEGKREHVYHAAMLDPLVAATMPLDCIWAMVDELMAAHGDALPEWPR
ncbi:MAG TPA: alpha-glucosidase/alpha-galactosidase [Anaerolineales bacterium]|nr:alpha-glucosidase/alpha-galactosidase [Anaerolineales bacterium]